MPERLEGVVNGARLYRPIQTVGVAYDVPEAADEILTGHGYTVLRDGFSGGMPPEELTALLGDDTDALITRTSLSVTADVLKNSRLQAVFGGCKRPRVDIKAAQKLGVEVLGAHANTEQVVQHVMAALLSFSTGNVQGAITTQQGLWQKKSIGDSNFTLRNTRLGILGFGRIGRMLAEVAMANKLEVRACNDLSETHRPYEDYLIDCARRMGVGLTDRKGDLLDWADVLTVHTGLEDHAGRSNKGLVSPDDLIRMGRNGGRGIFINYDRDGIGPSPEKIQELLVADHLKRYAVDVFPPDTESDNPGRFVYPFKPGDPRVIATPHIAGSSPEVLDEAAREAATNLHQWAWNGSLRDNSLTYPRLDMPVDHSDGQVVVAIARSTRKGISAEVMKVFDDSGLSVVGGRTTNDNIPGTSIDRGTAYQVVESTPVDHQPYETIVRSVALGLAALNSRNPGSILSVRPIPTNKEQMGRLNHLFRG